MGPDDGTPDPPAHTVDTREEAADPPDDTVDAQAAADDRTLLARHVAGDPDAFAVLVRRHQDRLWAVAVRTLGDRDEAADALQDALVHAFRRAGQYRGEAAVTTWLHRIVVNACLDQVRRRRARPADPLPDGADGRLVAPDHGGGNPEHRDVALDVHAALARLPVDQRAALVLVDMQGYSVTEAAEILGCAEGTVKSRCARGRARLLPLLTAHDPRRAGGNRPAGGHVEAQGGVPAKPAQRAQEGGAA